MPKLKSTTGTLVSASATELNLLDGKSAVGTSTVYPVEFLVVGGGGGGSSGWAGGGGGGGGYRNSFKTGSENTGGNQAPEMPAIMCRSGVQYTITVGDGGTGGRSSAAGGHSSFGYILADGGGTANGLGGSSGGGSNHGTGVDKNIMFSNLGTKHMQGYAGGTGAHGIGNGRSAGGGGAGAVGIDGPTNAGGGGAGLSSSITGAAVTRAGGGGGGAQNASDGAGGSGGGGAGNKHPASGTAGTTNTGGGGGGTGRHYNTSSGAGGSGVVILRMLTSDYSGTISGSPTVDQSTVALTTILIYNASGTYTA